MVREACGSSSVCGVPGGPPRVPEWFQTCFGSMARTPKDPQSHLFRLPSSMIVRRFAPRFPPGNLWGSLGSALFRPGPPRGLARLRKVSNARPRSRARLCVIFARISRVPRLRLIPSSPCVCAQRSFYKSSEAIRRSRARFRGGGYRTPQYYSLWNAQ